MEEKEKIVVENKNEKKIAYFSIDQILSKQNNEDLIEVRKNGESDIDLNDTTIKFNECVKNEESIEKKESRNTPSYTAIIAQAILSSKEKKLPLGDVYEYIAENFPDFLKKGQGWRNCVRHNLSLSECFVKAGRARNGRGNYWGIHPRYIKNFSLGDYRKRRASHRQRSFGPSFVNCSYQYNQYILEHNKTFLSKKASFTMESILSPEHGKHRVPLYLLGASYNEGFLRPNPNYFHHAYSSRVPKINYSQEECIPKHTSNQNTTYVSELTCSCPKCPTF